MPLIRKPPADASAEAVAGGDRFAALRTGSNDERWAAARGLAGEPGGVAALGHALVSETNARVREAIFTSLARVGTPESFAAVLPHLHSDDAAIRTGALDALRAMPVAARTCLPAVFEDPDPDVRLLACEIVRGLSSADATALLVPLLERENQVNVCASAVEVLAEIGEPPALDALARCAARFSAEPFLVFSIKVASERIGSQSNKRE
jgi:HEAT repeat protein